MVPRVSVIERFHCNYSLVPRGVGSGDETNIYIDYYCMRLVESMSCTGAVLET